MILSYKNQTLNLTKERYLNRKNVKHVSIPDNEWKATENKRLHVEIYRLSEAIKNAH